HMSQRSLIQLGLRLGLLAAACASLSGCLLRVAVGNVVIVPDLGEQIDTVVTTALANSTASVCNSSASPPDITYTNCQYVIDGVMVASTNALIANGGLEGVLIDPVILEVPADVISATGSYDTGGGPQPLIINRRDWLPVQPGKRITAEVGMTLLVLDVP